MPEQIRIVDFATDPEFALIVAGGTWYWRGVILSVERDFVSVKQMVCCSNLHVHDTWLSAVLISHRSSAGTHSVSLTSGTAQMNTPSGTAASVRHGLTSSAVVVLQISYRMVSRIRMPFSMGPCTPKHGRCSCAQLSGRAGIARSTGAWRSSYSMRGTLWGRVLVSSGSRTGVMDGLQTCCSSSWRTHSGQVCPRSV